MAIDREALKNKVGENLRALREQRGLTQAEVVKGIGDGMCTAATLSLYERGDRLVTLDVLLALSSFYGVPVDTICDTTDVQTPVTAGSFLRMIVRMCETAHIPPVIQTEDRPFDEVFTDPGEEEAYRDYDEIEQRDGYAPSVTVTTITIKENVVGRFLHDYQKMIEGDILNKPAFIPAFEAWKKDELRRADQMPL